MLSINFLRNSLFFYFLLVFNVCIFSLLAGLLAFHTFFPNSVQTSPSSSPTTHQNQENSLSNLQSLSYPSLNGQKVLVLFRESSGAEADCSFVVQDMRNYELLSSLPDSKTVRCINAFPFVSLEVIGWSGDRYLLFEPAAGHVIAYDFFKEEWREVTVEATKQEWLTRANFSSEKSPEGKMLISQTEGEIDVYNLLTGVLEKSISLNDEKVELFFDPTNQGYLVMGRTFSSIEGKQTAQTNIYFMPLQTLNPRLIASTQPLKVIGRGCAGAYIQGSELGKIFFQAGGCYKLNEERSELFEINLRSGTLRAVAVGE